LPGPVPGIFLSEDRHAVVRAAARKLTPEARRDPAKRNERHRFYRQMLEFHREAQEIVSYWRL